MDLKNIYRLIGKQLARMRYAQIYAAMIMQMVTALSVLVLALAELNIQLTSRDFIIGIIIGSIVYWFFGLLIDKSGIKKGEVENDINQAKDTWLPVYETAFYNALIRFNKEVNDDD